MKNEPRAMNPSHAAAPTDTAKPLSKETVRFRNQFGIPLSADCYAPEGACPADRKPAVVIAGPFGAVKAQQAGVCARALARLGFLTVAFDPSYLGESGGSPRFMASPDINTEDIRAAVDALLLRADVDRDKIAVLGLGGWGALALRAAAIDSRIAAVITVAMQDIGRLLTNGAFDDEADADLQYRKIQQLNLIRTQDVQHRRMSRTKNDPKASPLVPSADELAYYQSVRNFQKGAPNSLHGWTMTGAMSYLFQTLTPYLSHVRCPVLMIQGGLSAERYDTEEAFRQLPDSKKNRLRSLPECTNTALLCAPESLPFQEISDFLSQALMHSSIQKRRTYTALEPQLASGCLVLNFASDAAEHTAQALAMMTRGDCLTYKNTQAAARARRSLTLIPLFFEEGGACDPDLIQWLESEAFRGKQIIPVALTKTNLGAAREKAIADVVQTRVQSALPYCSVLGSICIAAGAPVGTLIQDLAGIVAAKAQEEHTPIP